MTFPDLSPPAPPPGPLVPVDTLAALLGLTLPLTPPLDAQVEFAAGAVSDAIRAYTGRILTRGTYSEAWPPQPETAGFGIDGRPPLWRVTEWPIASLESAAVDAAAVDVASLRFHASLGNVWWGDPAWPGTVLWSVFALTYVGGYDPIPRDLQAVVLDLVRKQLVAMGADLGGGGGPLAPGQAKAVTVGALKVDFAVPTASFSDYAATFSTPLGADALAQYSGVLDFYRSSRTLMATGR